MSCGVFAPPRVDPCSIGREVSGRYAVVKEKRAEAFQGLVALAGEGFHEVVGSDDAIAEETLCQVPVSTNELDEWAVADARKADATRGESVSKRESSSHASSARIAPT